MSITGPEDGAPCRVGASVGDIFAGHQAAIGILAALIHRGKSGRGQFYDGAMVDGLFFVLENAVVQHTIGHKTPKRLGSAHPTIAPFQSFRTKDGWIVIAIGTDKSWSQFCNAAGRTELIGHPEFKTNLLRAKNRKALAEIIESETVKRTTKSWSKILERESIAYSPINNIREICEDPCIKHRDMLVELEQPQMGRIKIAGSPLHLSETPGAVYAPAPLLGEHSKDILKSLLKYSPEEISELEEAGVINS
jgi:CoA:oxalate CoA-transferase